MAAIPPMTDMSLYDNISDWCFAIGMFSTDNFFDDFFSYDYANIFARNWLIDWLIDIVYCRSAEIAVESVLLVHTTMVLAGILRSVWFSVATGSWNSISLFQPWPAESCVKIWDSVDYSLLYREIRISIKHYDIFKNNPLRIQHFGKGFQLESSIWSWNLQLQIELLKLKFSTSQFNKVEIFNIKFSTPLPVGILRLVMRPRIRIRAI